MQPEEVRQVRRVLGISQATLAQLVGVATNSVARWEQGRLGIRESAARLMQRLLEDAQRERARARVSGRGGAGGAHAVERGSTQADGEPGVASAGRALLPTARAALAADLQVERHRGADRRRSGGGGPRRRKGTS